MSVGGRTQDRLGSDVAVSARTVFDDELLTEPLRQPLTYQARGNVGSSGWSIANDDAYRPRRIGLSPRDPRHGRQRGNARGEMQEFTAGKFHRGLHCGWSFADRRLWNVR